MLIIPAVDLKNGQCVRLKQGLMEDATVFSENPAETALHWKKLGARRLHLVDLDGAFSGTPENLPAIRAILAAVAAEIPVQLGGGIRDMQTIEKYLDLGLHSVIIGTAAVKNPALVREACRAFPGRVIVGIDAKDGKTATDGWANVTDTAAADLAKQFADDGVAAVIYTDIGRDGMLCGINTAATAALAEEISVPVIASGGLTGLDDVRALCAAQSSGIAGVIAGRAIYSGALDFQAAQQLADSLS